MRDVVRMAPDLTPTYRHRWKAEELRDLLVKYAERDFNQPETNRMVPVRLASRPILCLRCAAASPGYTGCGKCGHTWDHRENHCVDYKRGHGAFVLCEGCWKKSTTMERLAYYQERFRLALAEDARGQSAYWPGESTIGEIIDRVKGSLEDWPLIEAAVLAAE